MSKQTPTKDVFARLAEPDDSAEPESTAAQAEPDDQTTSDEADEVEEADKAGETGDDVARPPSRARRRIVIAVVGVIVIASLGLSAFLGWRLYRADQTAAASQAALEAAKNYAVVLTTLDAGDIDKNYAQAVEGATGQFKDEYGQGSAQLRQILIDNKAAGKGLVLDAAVKSATRTKVEVLLFVDQSVTNAVLPEPRIDRNRVQMTMELVGDRWLASNVDLM